MYSFKIDRKGLRKMGRKKHWMQQTNRMDKFIKGKKNGIMIIKIMETEEKKMMTKETKKTQKNWKIKMIFFLNKKNEIRIKIRKKK